MPPKKSRVANLGNHAKTKKAEPEDSGESDAAYDEPPAKKKKAENDELAAACVAAEAGGTGDGARVPAYRTRYAATQPENTPVDLEDGLARAPPPPPSPRTPEGEHPNPGGSAHTTSDVFRTRVPSVAEMTRRLVEVATGWTATEVRLDGDEKEYLYENLVIMERRKIAAAPPPPPAPAPDPNTEVATQANTASLARSIPDEDDGPGRWESEIPPDEMLPEADARGGKRVGAGRKPESESGKGKRSKIRKGTLSSRKQHGSDNPRRYAQKRALKEKQRAGEAEKRGPAPNRPAARRAGTPERKRLMTAHSLLVRCLKKRKGLSHDLFDRAKHSAAQLKVETQRRSTQVRAQIVDAYVRLAYLHDQEDDHPPVNPKPAAAGVPVRAHEGERRHEERFIYGSLMEIKHEISRVMGVPYGMVHGLAKHFENTCQISLPRTGRKRIDRLIDPEDRRILSRKFLRSKVRSGRKAMAARSEQVQSPDDSLEPEHICEADGTSGEADDGEAGGDNTWLEDGVEVNLSRTAVLTVKAYQDYCNNVLLKDEPRMPAKGISLSTARRWMHDLGFIYNGRKKGIYYDGHEDPKNLKYRDEKFLPLMHTFYGLMRHYHGDQMQLEDPPGEPTLKERLDAAGEKEHVLVTQDECVASSFDVGCSQWSEQGRPTLAPKGQGESLHISGFFSERFGDLRCRSEGELAQAAAADIEAHTRVIIKPGKNRDGWWTGELLCKQFEHAIKVFEITHPGCIGVFLFDHSTIHHRKSEDVMQARTLNPDWGGGVPLMREGYYGPDNTPQSLFFQPGEKFRINCKSKAEKDKSGKVVKEAQTFKVGDDVPLEFCANEETKSPGIYKGVLQILAERGLLEGVAKRTSDCTNCVDKEKTAELRAVDPKAKQVKRKHADLEADDYEPCCAVRVLEAQPDFKAQVSAVEEIAATAGKLEHKVAFLPKFYCELNFIERVWGRMKWFTRKHGDFTLGTLKKLVLLGLSDRNVPLELIRKYARISWRYMDAYRQMTAKYEFAPPDLVERIVRKFKSHRMVDPRLDEFFAKELGIRLHVKPKAASSASSQSTLPVAVTADVDPALAATAGSSASEPDVSESELDEIFMEGADSLEGIDLEVEWSALLGDVGSDWTPDDIDDSDHESSAESSGGAAPAQAGNLSLVHADDEEEVDEDFEC